jgi:hypothetical protein
MTGSMLLVGLELCEPCRLFRIRTDPRVLDFVLERPQPVVGD